MDYYRLVLDIIIASLLVATIIYATMLNKRLNSLRKNREDMAKLISQFNEATVRAESSIPKLRKAADEAGQTLQERVEKAQSLRDDLAFMIERADTSANRLEQAVRTSRNDSKPNLATRPAPPPIAAPALSVESDDGERSEAERDLLRALQSLR